VAYLTLTDADRAAMLQAVGAKTIDDLFTSIPAHLRGAMPSLPAPLSEQELVQELKTLARRNRPASIYENFLGAGTYRRYIPAIVGATISRPEFYTAYTPYQAEASQGTLQTIFEFQSMICELYGMDVANASLYDGATAAAEAVLLAAAQTRRTRVVLAGALHPDIPAVVRTFAHAHALDIVEMAAGEVTFDDNTAAVLVGRPGFFGTIEDHRPLVDEAHAHGALAIAYADPFACALIASPGECGFDIAVGDGQQFGIPLSFGGPHLGLIAVSAALMRRIPGRLVGQTSDNDGRRAFTLTLQAREQHIRREKASSNICTNHALMALAATAYMGYMGAAGIRHLAEVSVARAHELASRLAKAGWERVDSEPFLWEFRVRVPGNATDIAKQLRSDGIIAGLPLGGVDSKLSDQMLIACTELTSPAAIETFASKVATMKRAKVTA
jgi:glycine dehydrogenase subunit 1